MHVACLLAWSSQLLCLEDPSSGAAAAGPPPTAATTATAADTTTTATAAQLMLQGERAVAALARPPHTAAPVPVVQTLRTLLSDILTAPFRTLRVRDGDARPGQHAGGAAGQQGARLTCRPGS